MNRDENSSLFRLSKKSRDHKRRKTRRERPMCRSVSDFRKAKFSKKRIVFTKSLETSSFKGFFACFPRSVTSRSINIHLRVPFGQSHTFLDSLTACQKFFDTLNRDEFSSLFFIASGNKICDIKSM